MKVITVTNTAIENKVTPGAPGFNAVVHNTSGGSLVLQGSADNGVADPYATLATVAAGAYANITLPKWMKVSTAATLYVLT
jgi:hypothetical protein